MLDANLSLPRPNAVFVSVVMIASPIPRPEIARMRSVKAMDSMALETELHAS